ncbi:MAG: 50S ribosomal protein L19 [Candidatus Woesebacteria bacterium GW2011_GWA1_33_30]|uniref:50S ribosomal protein L19 n=1 Tax=Candidatus Woesebacteria bacterium GW2011_GWA2_33_28 TaxID=1618561 RepID=A0A0G0A6X2_9BACT|nr:MAG: 50S ribosomal protein L19 [Candidatus Woesebacteria bacterium GW2011_GWA2_33_28]KKP47873.1 MAG: 50S ribosomal protein L19 [Candidatus Woesebacteria bacterium GW2011_GWA1_33_30]KKP49316.1 MAG: 50S ribosomal protein L19 [Microgenomates group bacterium GW2011_GWC1_33_32]KKP52026.1 MAG: 50S ribosomal protein L19 [Candidatus Woesebacteria bacterium GW2011_GWB1_33_38]KKP57930.1 MAG: 50S ribosomal protein L19 [Microgenomates group bacterium GW2011_GWD1_33_9]
MALKIKHKEVEFGIGDRIKVFQRIKEGDKTRVAFFDGMVLAIKGETGRKMFTVRRIGEAAIGIERIFPVDLPTIEKIEVIKKGTKGVKRAKLYYTRNKAPKEIDKIYWRSNAREKSKLQKEVKTSKKVKKTKTSKAKK